MHDADVSALLVMARQRLGVGRLNRERRWLVVEHRSNGQVEEGPFGQVVGGVDGTKISRAFPLRVFAKRPYRRWQMTYGGCEQNCARLDQHLNRGARTQCQHELAKLRHEQRRDGAGNNAAFPASEWSAADYYSRVAMVPHEQATLIVVGRATESW